MREEDHDRSDDDDSQDRINMTVNTEARDKEMRREAFLASQIPTKSSKLYVKKKQKHYKNTIELCLRNFNALAVSDDESEHGHEEEEWEAQQIRKGVTGAQVNFCGVTENFYSRIVDFSYWLSKNLSKVCWKFRFITKRYGQWAWCGVSIFINVYCIEWAGFNSLI